jgi:hypothetical protein
MIDNRVYRPEDPMYIKIHSYQNTVTWESPHHDTNLAELFANFKNLLITIGFMPDTIDSCIIEMAEEIDPQKDLFKKTR